MPLVTMTPFKLGLDGFILLLGGSGDDRGQSVALDNNNPKNILVSGFENSQGVGGYDGVVAKFNNTGDIQWQRTFGSADSDGSYGVVGGSANQAYIVGAAQSPSNMMLARVDASGTLTWQRVVTSSTNRLEDIALDSSGNLYCVGNFQDGTYHAMSITKYNPSGTLQWQRKIGAGTGNTYGKGIVIDGADNPVVVGYSPVSGSDRLLLAKYNSSGTLQWKIRSNGGSGEERGYSVAVDATNQIHVAGFTSTESQGGVDVFFAKYNNAGTLVYQRTLGGSGGDWGLGVDVDSSSKAYVVGYTPEGPGSLSAVIAKYDSSGAVEWQRTLSSVQADYFSGVVAGNDGYIYLTGYSSSNGSDLDILVAKLPDDGSGLGNYGPFVYEESSLVGGTPTTITYATSSLTEAASSLTPTTSSLTFSSSTLTVNRIA
jgi:uncharacterized delta-60 repeat protein